MGYHSWAQCRLDWASKKIMILGTRRVCSNNYPWPPVTSATCWKINKRSPQSWNEENSSMRMLSQTQRQVSLLVNPYNAHGYLLKEWSPQFCVNRYSAMGKNALNNSQYELLWSSKSWLWGIHSIMESFPLIWKKKWTKPLQAHTWAHIDCKLLFVGPWTPMKGLLTTIPGIVPRQLLRRAYGYEHIQDAAGGRETIPKPFELVLIIGEDALGTRSWEKGPFRGNASKVFNHISNPEFAPVSFAWTEGNSPKQENSCVYWTKHKGQCILTF